jgi:hypothetical protein
MKFMIEVTVDTNDGDYVSETRDISVKELEKIRPLLSAMKKFESYQVDGRWFNCCYPSEEQREDGEKTARKLYPEISKKTFDIFNDYIPHPEYGYGKFVSVKIRQVVEEEELYYF